MYVGSRHGEISLLIMLAIADQEAKLIRDLLYPWKLERGVRTAA